MRASTDPKEEVDAQGAHERGRWALEGRAAAFHASWMRRFKVLGVAGLAAAVYGGWVRPRLVRWGATDEEVTGPYPGADVVPEGKRGPTMGVTIAAPPDQVWPWLVQMGGDRGGWYSWDRLDNGGRPSAHEVHPEWQDLAVGDFVKYWRRDGAVDAWRVAVLEPNRFLGLHGLTDLRLRNLDPEQPRPRGYTEGLWGFLLTGLPGGRTRLVIGGYEAFRPRWLGRVFSYAPVVWIMQARTMAVLKRNVESAARTRRQSASLLRLASCARVSASLGQVPYSRAAVSISRLSCSFSGS